jgi:hypothetical protein
MHKVMPKNCRAGLATNITNLKALDTFTLGQAESVIFQGFSQLAKVADG